MSIRGMDEALVEEDLGEVEGRLFVTIVKDQDTTYETARIQRDCHAAIILSLTMRWRIALYY